MIIAEAGVNHLGDMKLAKKLIEEARINGASLVKFQLYDADKLIRDYGTLALLRKAQLSQQQAQELFDYGKNTGIEVFFSVFDVERVDWCEKIGVKRYKIGARMRNRDVLESLVKTKKELIISYDENLTWNPNEKITNIYKNHKSLYCVSKYPALSQDIKFTDGEFEDENSGEYSASYDGYSDHTIGIDVAKIALARGAQIIEKHFALDHRTGVDAAWSMTGTELAELKRWESICKEVL